MEITKDMSETGYPIEPAHIPASLSDSDIDEFVRTHGINSQHYLSSCRMLPLERGGVVDHELRVYGVRGLRIADGSVFPGIVASRPQATVVMIAERCAEFLRHDWADTKEGEREAAKVACSGR
jgi:choline dehydrogenase-like flavoprotein